MGADLIPFDQARMPDHRKKDGEIWHPDFSNPQWYDGNPLDEVPISHDVLAEKAGLQLKWVECDEPEDYDTGGMLRWLPKPPTGDGWWIVAIDQSEDGYFAAFVRRTPPQAAQGDVAIAVDFLEQFVEVIRSAAYADIERFPYLPAVEEVIESLKSTATPGEQPVSVVERFDFQTWDGNATEAYMSSCQNGEYVRHADHAATESRNAELGAEVAELKRQMAWRIDNWTRCLDAERDRKKEALRRVDDLETRVALADVTVTRYKAALDCAESQCWDVRCESGQIADTGDSDVWFEVGEHCHGKPDYRVLGMGGSPLAAIEDAQRADDDPAKSTYVPPEFTQNYKELEDHESGGEGQCA